MDSSTLCTELVNAFTDVTVEHHSIPDQAGVAQAIWSDANSSNEWYIDNVQLKCDLCTLDSALDNSYAEHMLSGKSLPINYNTYINQTQNITGQVDIAINVSRAISRLKSVFINFSKKTSKNRISPNRGEAINFGNDQVPPDPYDNGILASFGDINKPWNGF